MPLLPLCVYCTGSDSFTFLYLYLHSVGEVRGPVVQKAFSRIFCLPVWTIVLSGLTTPFAFHRSLSSYHSTLYGVAQTSLDTRGSILTSNVKWRLCHPLKTLPWFTQFHTYEALKKCKRNWDNIFEPRAKFFFAGLKAQWDENGGRVLLGDTTGSRVVMLRAIIVQCAGVRMSPTLPCMYIHSWPYGYSILTCPVSSVTSCVKVVSPWNCGELSSHGVMFGFPCSEGRTFEFWLWDRLFSPSFLWVFSVSKHILGYWTHRHCDVFLNSPFIRMPNDRCTWKKWWAYKALLLWVWPTNHRI
jgi:hypothetical protein